MSDQIIVWLPGITLIALVIMAIASFAYIPNRWLWFKAGVAMLILASALPCIIVCIYIRLSWDLAGDFYRWLGRK